MNVVYLPGYRYPASLQEPLSCGDLRYSFNLSRALARKGMQVNVISRGMSRDESHANLDGVQIHRYSSELGSVLSTSYDLSANRYRLFQRLIRDADILICNSPLSAELLVRHELPFIYVCSGLEDVKNYGHTIKEIAGRIGLLLLRDPCKRRTWKRATFVNTTAVSEGQTLVRMGVPQNKITTIGPGVELSRYYPRPSTEFCRLQETFSRSNKIVLSVARFTPAKGLLETLEAFQLLLEQQPDARLLLVGVQHSHSPSYFVDVTNRVKQLGLKKYVAIKQNVPEQDMPAIYSMARVTSAFSVKYDPLPTVIIESMSCGTPVVSTYFETRTQMITDGQNGLFVPECDLQKWVAGVNRILSDDDFHRRLSFRGLESVRQSFDMDKIATRYLELIEGSGSGAA